MQTLTDLKCLAVGLFTTGGAVVVIPAACAVIVIVGLVALIAWKL